MTTYFLDDDDETFEALDLIPDIVSKIVYVHSVTHCLGPGTYMELHGRINEGCTRFSVDFTCGPRSGMSGTIALHFNPRLQEGYVVRNNLQNGYWGVEETTSSAPFTLIPGEEFELLFYVTRQEFHIRVNGLHFCSFRHRVQWERITSVECVGDIQITQAATKASPTYPVHDDKLNLMVIPCDQKYDGDTGVQLPMPYTGKLEQKLKAGDHVQIFGKVKLLPHSFYVNLQHGSDIYPHPIIPLHLNPRFSASCGSNAFVRNAWTRGKWLQEERAPGFPFVPGYSFTLTIQIEATCYGIWVNDKLIAEYPYRVENQYPVNTIYIQGDIFLQHVSLHTKSRYALYGFPDEKPLITDSSTMPFTKAATKMTNLR